MTKNNRPELARKLIKKPKPSVRASESSTYLDEINLAIHYQNSGQIDQSIGILERILAKDSQHIEANYALGMLYHRVGKNNLAIPLLKRTVALRPKLFDAVLNLGIIQRAMGLLTEAQATLENALSIKPNSSKAHVMLGLLLIDRNEIDAAGDLFTRAIALQPRNAEAHAQMGFVHKTRGALDKAADCYRRAIALNPTYGEAHRGLAYLRRYQQSNKDVELMEQIYRAPATPESERMLLGFALGKIFDDLKQYDKAFYFLCEGNRLKRQTFSFSIEKNAALFDLYKHFLNRDFIDRMSDCQLADQTPIFVLGMPRSGTSLAEQILASHPAVYGAGEVDYLRVITDCVEKITGKTFPENLNTVNGEALRVAAQNYIDKLKTNAGDAQHVTDKLPHNFLRVGLIKALMPNAKIIHCDRNPLDNCLSIYQHYFSAHHGYASDLTELGQYYKLYENLMNYWHELLPQQIYRISYEKLIDDTESEVRKLLEYCELPFDAACLSFHTTERIVNTPSAAQVREPIYKNAIARWKNYDDHLRPLRVALGVFDS